MKYVVCSDESYNNFYQDSYPEFVRLYDWHKLPLPLGNPKFKVMSVYLCRDDLDFEEPLEIELEMLNDLGLINLIEVELCEGELIEEIVERNKFEKIGEEQLEFNFESEWIEKL